MTGRGAGYCAGYGVPGYANVIRGRGFGPGWGRGNWHYATGLLGWSRFEYAPAWGPVPVAYGAYGTPPAPGQEAELLKTQSEWLKRQLDAISQRITELEQKE